MRIRRLGKKSKKPPKPRIDDLRALLDEFAAHSPEALGLLRKRVLKTAVRDG